jgi:hypothetical protein
MKFEMSLFVQSDKEDEGVEFSNTVEFGRITSVDSVQSALSSMYEDLIGEFVAAVEEEYPDEETVESDE